MPQTDIIPCYRNAKDLFDEGEQITSFFTALSVSEICLMWNRKVDAPLNFVLPPNVESLRVEVQLQPFTDFEALSEFLALNRHIRELTFDRLPAQSNQYMQLMQ